jgi:Trypsin.
MMLTDYEEYPPLTTEVPGQRKKKKKDAPVKNGERSKATNWFNALAAKDDLLKTTVLLQTGVAFASGVILGVDDNKAYILTAKHNLFILAGQLKPIDKGTGADKKPSDYALTDYSGGIKIGYRPAALLQAPEDPPRTTTVQVTGFNFGGIEDGGDSWTYDAMLFECTNTAFKTYVDANRFIKKANYESYTKALEITKGKLPLLNRRLTHIQLGYGFARASDMDIQVDNYTSYEKKIQCKQSTPSTVTVCPVMVYEPSTQERDRSKWRSMSRAIELDAGNTKSTAPGDSGGPLFAIQDAKFALVGVTSGANFYSQESKLKKPPSDRVINNNVVTYWHEIFKNCAFLNRE